MGYNEYRKYYENNKEKILAANKKYRDNNKEKLKLRAQEKRMNKKLIKTEEDVELENIMQIKRKKENFNKFVQNNVEYQLAHSLRNRIRIAIRNNATSKSKQTLELLGCSISEFKEYINKKFKPGMSWDNRGKWHVDHIIPCCKFDLADIKEQKKCFHYTNLQPLWARENLQKSGF